MSLAGGQWASGWWVMLPGPSRYAEIMAERERANTAGFVKKKATKKSWSLLEILRNIRTYTFGIIWIEWDGGSQGSLMFAANSPIETGEVQADILRDTVETKSRSIGQCFPTAFPFMTLVSRLLPQFQMSQPKAECNRIGQSGILRSRMSGMSCSDFA